MNLLRLRPDRFFNAIHFTMLRRVKPEDVDEFERSLTEPLPTPPGFGTVKKPTPMEAEDEAAGFMALYAQVKGG